MIGLLCPGFVSGQQTFIKASIDSTHILIGDQTNIHLEIVSQKGKELQLPVFGDTIITGIEILGVSKPDTVDLGNNNIQIKQNYLVTSFDSAIFVIPPFEVIEGSDTILSNSLGLKVSTLPVDVESKKFFDIKDVIVPPFVLSDYATIIWSVIGVLVLILIAWYLYEVKRGRKSLNLFKKKEEPELPPYIVAINELDEIKSKKLWQQGLNKEYHSSVTDTLRKYIEKRFDTHAMEMTSGEILNHIKGVKEMEPVYNELKQILQLGDFVKFAKYQPLPDENDLSLTNAYTFVNETKPETPPLNTPHKGELEVSSMEEKVILDEGMKK